MGLVIVIEPHGTYAIYEQIVRTKINWMSLEMNTVIYLN